MTVRNLAIGILVASLLVTGAFSLPHPAQRRSPCPLPGLSRGPANHLQDTSRSSAGAAVDRRRLQEPRSLLAAGHSQAAIQQGGQPVSTRAETLPASLGQPITGQYAVFLFYTWNRDMFLQTFQSLTRAGFRRIIILDNSADHDASDHAVPGAEIVHTRISLTFAQLHNIARSIAVERGFEFYFWAHSDVVVMPHSADRSFSQEAVKCIMETADMNPTWGVAYFAYDWLAGFRTAAVAGVPWDEYLPHYKADCDYYQAVRLAGWTTHECGHVGRVFHMSNTLAIPDDYDAAIKLLEDDNAHPRDDTQRTAWRDATMQRREEVGRAKSQQGADRYYVEKWNTEACDIPRNVTPWTHKPDARWRRAERALLAGHAEEREADGQLHGADRALLAAAAGDAEGGQVTKSLPRTAGATTRHGHGTRSALKAEGRATRTHAKQPRTKVPQPADPALQALQAREEEHQKLAQIFAGQEDKAPDSATAGGDAAGTGTGSKPEPVGKPEAEKEGLKQVTKASTPADGVEYVEVEERGALDAPADSGLVDYEDGERSAAVGKPAMVHKDAAGAGAKPSDPAAQVSLKSSAEPKAAAGQQGDDTASGAASFAVFLFHRWNPGMVLQARNSLLRSGFTARQISILDNSRKHDLTGMGLAGTEVIPTRTSLTLSQLHSAARSIALERKLDVYFWLDAHAMVMNKEAGLQFSAEALRCIEAHTESDPKWAVMFFDHDRHFAAFRTDAVSAFSWDSYIQHAKAACDYYHTLRLQHLTTPTCETAGLVFPMEEAVHLPLEHDRALHAIREAQARAVEAAAQRDAKAMPWWQDAWMTVRESVGHAIMGEAGEEYYAVKWGSDKCELPADTQPWPANDKGNR